MAIYEHVIDSLTEIHVNVIIANLLEIAAHVLRQNVCKHTSKIIFHKSQ